MRKFLLCSLVIVLSMNLISSQIDHTYPSLSDEEFEMFQTKYIQEKDENEKKYIEPVLRPEKFDLNKDRKISRSEVKEALIYMCYPTDQKKAKQLPAYFDEHVRNNIDVFVKNIQKDFLTYKQFAYLVRKVSVGQFMNYDYLESRHLAQKDARDEGEADL